MSIFGSIGSVVKGAAKGFLTGGLPGAVVGGALGGVAKVAKPGTGMIPGVAKTSIPTLKTLPGGGGGALPPLIGGAVSMAGSAGRALGNVGRAAANMCARYPAWCAGVGGVAAIATLMHNGTLPVPRRRRRKGITPRDLQSFRRVANLVKQYSAPVRHMRTTTRGKKTCR